MMCELLKQDGSVVGAVGFHIRSGQTCVIGAGAVVMATGSINLKSGSYPVYYWSGDGESMAYRAGAEVAGAEFSYLNRAPRGEAKQAEQNRCREDMLGSPVRFVTPHIVFLLPLEATGLDGMVIPGLMRKADL